MKKTLSLIACIICIVIVSCQKETIETPTKQETNLISTSINRGLTIDDPCCHEENLFERQLQWFSFIASSAMQQPAVNAEISAYVGLQQGAKIKAGLLIGDFATLTSFRDEFMIRLTFYASGSAAEPEQETAKPELPIEPDPPFMPLTTQQIVDRYMNAILVENCVELYFPKTMNFTGNFNLVSSSHPLTSANTNEAIIRYSIAQGGTGITNENGSTSYIDQYTTEAVVLNQSYVNTHNNIIIARPIKVSLIPGTHCSYDDYSGIDFEDFMD